MDALQTIRRTPNHDLNERIMFFLLNPTNKVVETL